MYKVSNFEKAGLVSAGPARFAIDSMVREDATNKEGEDYTFLQAKVKVLETQADGVLIRPAKIRSRFFLSDSSLWRFRSLYYAAKGYIPTGDVDIDALAEELVGAEVYGFVVHGDPDEEGRVFPDLGVTFGNGWGSLDGFSK